MSEPRYASECPDQEMFSGLSPSQSTKNLLSHSNLLHQQMVIRVQLPQALQMQSRFPSDQTSLHQKKGVKAEAVLTVSARSHSWAPADLVIAVTPSLAWRAQCFLFSPLPSNLPFERSTESVVSHQRLSLAGTPTTGIYSPVNSHLPF